VGAREERNEGVVRALWAAFRAGGVEQALHLVDEDVEWQLLGTEGAVLHGPGELRDYLARRESAGEEVDAVPHSYRAAGDVVLVSGTWRVRGPGGLEERTAHWIYRLENGRLLRVEACSSLAECERILAEAAARPQRTS
jgi:ketosteroid isomerase-like protein